MSVEIIDFKRDKQNDGSFVGVLKNPIFCLLITEDGKVNEVLVQIKGEFPYKTPIDTSCYDEEAYRNYLILKEYLLSEKGQMFSNAFYLDSNILTIKIYKALVNYHSFFGWFKKKLLIILEYLKYYSGRFGI